MKYDEELMIKDLVALVQTKLPAKITEINVEKNDAKEAKIVIKLSDKGIFKNTLIGLFEFDLS